MTVPQQLPHDQQAERSVIGAMSFDPAAALEAMEILEPEDFYAEANQIIYRAGVELVQAEQPCDTVVLTDKLRREGLLATVGGAAYLALTVDSFPDVANVGHYARIVRDKSIKRQLIRVANHALNRAMADEGTAEELLAEAQEGVYRLAETAATSKPVRAGDLVDGRIELARKLSRGEISAPGMPTGWRTIDELTTGLHPGEVTLIAARTAVGKSSFVLDLSRRAAERGARVLYMSTEMIESSLVDKVIGAMARVNTKIFRETGYYLDRPDREQTTPNDRIELAAAKLRCPEHRLELWNCRDATPMKLRTRCRQMRAAGGLDLVVVDYVQQMRPDGAHREAHEGYIEISGELARLAGDLAVPVLACAQLNRDADRHDKEGKLLPPLLSEIGGSTRFEQDAYNVIFLSRDVGKEEEYTEVILAKSRLGVTGKRRLLFNRAESRFDQTGGGWS